MGRKEKKYHMIYKTTNLLNGKYYIGMHSTSNLEDGYMGSGRRLRYSINKHGKDNHTVEILEFVDTRKELIKREEEIVNLNEIAKVDCMNLKVGGSGGFKDEEHMIKCSKAGNEAKKLLLKTDEEYFKRHSENARKILKAYHATGKHNYKTFQGKKHSEESKLKTSKTMKGKGSGSDNSQFGKRWVTNGDETKKINKNDLVPKGWRLGRK